MNIAVFDKFHGKTQLTFIFILQDLIILIICNLNLFQCNKVPTYHLLLEGFLFLWVAWLLFRRVTKSRSRSHEGVRLTKEEEEELLAEWKPEPLVPEVDPNHPALHVPIVSGKVSLCSI